MDTFNAAEVMAVRPEDRDARQVQHAFADGATLAELEQHIAFLRSLGAPDDAHPKVGVNDDYEVTMMICIVERPTLSSRLRLKPALARLRVAAGRTLAVPELVRALDGACAASSVSSWPVSASGSQRVTVTPATRRCQRHGRMGPV